MKASLTRKEFLKLGSLALGSIFNPFPLPEDGKEYPTGELGRIAVADRISVYEKPDWESEVVGYLPVRDTLLNLYYEITPPTGPVYNPLWYRVWDGFVHSSYIQKVKVRFNKPLEKIPESGQLVEVTVPYSQIYHFDRFNKWQRWSHRLYYQTTHWAVGVEDGPDGNAWYRLHDEATEDQYHVPAEHLRPIPDSEISPISPEVPWEGKRIEVSLQDQQVRAYEDNRLIFTAKISSGIPGRRPTNGIPWDTPAGKFNIASKMPSKHMGDILILTGAPDDYTLPGVPWTCFFHETGVAFHGAYWHNNFGIPMSHGCVNMRVEDSKWLFRWTYPVFKLPIEEHADWEKRGYGTPVEVV